MNFLFYGRPDRKEKDFSRRPMLDGQNSTVIYLRRDLSLLPTSGRPMSQANPVETLYCQRAPLYEQLADLTVENRGTPAETANEIIRRLGL